MTDLEKQVLALGYSPEEIRGKTDAIRQATLAESPYLREGNFTQIGDEEIKRLYHRYDGSFFNGLFQQLLSREGEGGITFRVSSRMSSAGGKTSRIRRPVRTKNGVETAFVYELAVSAPLLFQTFRTEDRPILVAGVRCTDRLDALQRIVEHEMIHLLEFLVWRASSCDRKRFQRLAGNLFGHTEVKHELVTRREIAHTQLGIRVGDRVSFTFEGTRRTGRVNRITQRATVLVEHPRGQLYTNGKRYQKFYVPLSLLEPAGD